MYNEKMLLQKLSDMEISYEYISHPAVFTSDQANEVHPELRGAHCKNLFVKDRTNQKWLLTIPDDKKTDLKHVASVIGSSRLSFCNSDELMECLGVTPGSVTPLAVINDTQNKVILYVDETVMNWDVIRCHPLINTATISISGVDFRKFIAYCNHDLNIAQLV